MKLHAQFHTFNEMVDNNIEISINYCVEKKNDIFYSTLLTDVLFVLLFFLLSIDTVQNVECNCPNLVRDVKLRFFLFIFIFLKCYKLFFI